MPEITLAAELGRPLGSAESRRLRHAGKIPGVLYGHGSDPVPVAVAARELRIALSGESGTNTLLSLRAGDQTFLALARELQRHPVRGTVTHIDFQIVRRDEVLAAEVPVTLIGEAIEVNHGDGRVDQQLFALTINARPADIPTNLEVDISELTIGSTIRVADLPLPSGVSTEVDPEAAVVIGQPPRIAGAEEGGEAPAAEGAPAEADGS
ncbi:MAG TPA: 50S ribosomal protein L25 [Acidimicrobiales bacterium]|jgi:large subunit ribosomal protein L25